MYRGYNIFIMHIGIMIPMNINNYLRSLKFLVQVKTKLILLFTFNYTFVRNFQCKLRKSFLKFVFFFFFS